MTRNRVVPPLPWWVVLLTLPLWIWFVPLWVAWAILRGFARGFRGRGRRSSRGGRRPATQRRRRPRPPENRPFVWRKGY